MDGKIVTIDSSVRSELIEWAIPDSGDLLTHASEKLDEIRSRGKAILRWGLVSQREKMVTAEFCCVSEPPRQPAAQLENPQYSDSINIAVIIPTGVGASIGGFIGDAGPVAQSFEAVSDHVILHPNVVNGADLYGGGNSAMYVDGLSLDKFFAGQVRLSLPSRRRVGLILDRMDQANTTQLLNAANAMCSVRGVEMVGYSICRERTRGSVRKSPLGHFVGELVNPSVLYEAAERLTKAGAEVLAVVTATEGIPQNYWHEHYNGLATNPIGAFEALISRAITWKTGVPCAHAPAYVDGMATIDAVVDPRAAAEVISRTGLPCILQGLANASIPTPNGGIGIRDLAAIIVPFDCAGGAPALASREFNIPLVAVRSNRCAVGVAAHQLGIPIVAVQNYPEAIAYVAAKRAGVAWAAINGNLDKLREI